MSRLIDAYAFEERIKSAVGMVEYDLTDDFKDGILSTLELLKSEPTAQQWISVTSRPMDDEERKEWSEKLGYDIEYEESVIYDSQLPDDGQEVLTCDRYGNVRIDTFYNDVDYGCYFEDNGDMDDIVAWMPLPTPYTGE